MSLRGFGSLAKILEEAAKPDSQLREDRRERKTAQRKMAVVQRRTRQADPKRKAWYEKRLREIHQKASDAPENASSTPSRPASLPANVAKVAASQLSGSLLQVLANAKETKPKEGKQRIEAWRRKPGEPIF